MEIVLETYRETFQNSFIFFVNFQSLCFTCTCYLCFINTHSYAYNGKKMSFQCINIFVAFASFGSSGYGIYLGKWARQASKFVFALVFLPSLCILFLQTAAIPNTNVLPSLNTKMNNELNPNAVLDWNVIQFSPSQCVNICPPKNQTSIDFTLQDYCSYLWKYDIEHFVTILKFTLPQTHFIIQSILLCMFLLSTMEGFADKYMATIPYKYMSKGRFQRWERVSHI